jgi:hypothetical protein
MGIDNIANIIKPANAIKPETKFDSSNLSLARLTKGPTASPKPIHKNASKTGSVLFFI